MPDTDRRVHLPVHAGAILGDEGEGKVSPRVYCERRGALVPFSDCADCLHLRAIYKDAKSATSFVDCNDGRPASNLTDPGSLATTTPVGAILRHRFTLVRGETTWPELESALLDEDLRAVVVVDPNDKPVGLVSRKELLEHVRDAEEARAELPPGIDGPAHLDATPESTARDVMVECPDSLPADTPLSSATAIFALYDLREVPIVSAAGRVQGVLSSHDVLRWFATSMGYEVGVPGAQPESSSSITESSSSTSTGFVK